MERDILVIGAGILGLSSAYHLKRRNPEKKVLVMDKNSGPGEGNTAKCAGGFRNVFASESNYLLAESTIDWFLHLQNQMGYGINAAQIGYLWLLNEDEYMSLKAAFDKMQKRGIPLRTLDIEDLNKFIPDLTTGYQGYEEAELMGLESVHVGVQGIRCGIIDVDALVRSYEAEFLKLGGEVSYNTTATGLILKPERELGISGEPFVWQDIEIVGAETNRGEIRADTTVVAAGVWSERLLDPIGFDSMMRPKTRNIFVFKDPKLSGLMNVKGLNRYDILPLIQFPMIKVYLKVEPMEGSIWLGISDDFGRKIGLEDDPPAEADLYREDVRYALTRYFPCFENLGPLNMWAGQRAVNSFDKIPVVAPEPGMIYVGAATGNGILKCDSLGRIVASLYAGENEARLHGDRLFKVADLGVTTRNVEKETFDV